MCASWLQPAITRYIVTLYVHKIVWVISIIILLKIALDRDESEFVRRGVGDRMISGEVVEGEGAILVDRGKCVRNETEKGGGATPPLAPRIADR